MAKSTLLPGSEGMRPANISAPMEINAVPTGRYGQSQYSENVPFSRFGDTMDIRAENQRGWDVVGNMLSQSVLSTLGQTIEGVGSLLEIPEMAVTKWMGGEYEYDNALANIGTNLMDFAQRETPIYVDSKATPWSPERWAQMFPSVFSSLSLMLPGMGIAKGVGMIGKAARWGKLLTNSAGTFLGGAAMRHGENWMEAKQVHDQEYEKWINEGYGAETAEKAASDAASKTYSTNWINLAFDVAQLGAVTGLFKGMKWGAALGNESRLGQVMDHGYAATRMKGAFKDANILTRSALTAAGVTRPFYAQFTEGIEEAVNYFATKEGEREARLSLGEPLTDRDKKGTVDRFAEDVFSAEGLESAAWGVLGGAIFQTVGGMVENKYDLKERLKTAYGNKIDAEAIKNATDLQEIKNRESLIASRSAIINSDSSTPVQKELAKSDLIYDLYSKSRQAGNTDMLIDDLRRPSYTIGLAKSFGVPEAEASRTAANLAQEIELIEKAVDRYEGATLRAYMDSFSKKGYSVISDQDMMDKTRLTDDGDLSVSPLRKVNLGTTNPQTVRMFGKKDANGNLRFAFVEPAVAEMLAKNDYRMNVNSRLAATHSKAYLEFLQQKDFNLMEDPSTGALYRKTFEAQFRLEAALDLKRKYEYETRDRNDVDVDDKYFKLEKKTKMDAIDAEIKKQNDRIAEVEEEFKLTNTLAPLLPEAAQEKRKQTEEEWRKINDQFKKDAQDSSNLPAFENAREVMRGNIENEWLARFQVEVLKDPDNFVQSEIDKNKKLGKLAAIRKEQQAAIMAARAEMRKRMADEINGEIRPEYTGAIIGYTEAHEDNTSDELLQERAKAAQATIDTLSMVPDQMSTIEEFEKNFPLFKWMTANAELEAIKAIAERRGVVVAAPITQAGTVTDPEDTTAGDGTAAKRVQALEVMLQGVTQFENVYKGLTDTLAEMKAEKPSSAEASQLYVKESIRLLEGVLTEEIGPHEQIEYSHVASKTENDDSGGMTMENYQQQANFYGRHIFNTKTVIVPHVLDDRKLRKQVSRLQDEFPDNLEEFYDLFRTYGTVDVAIKNTDAIRTKIDEKLKEARAEAKRQPKEDPKEILPNGQAPIEIEPQPELTQAIEDVRGWNKHRIPVYVNDADNLQVEMSLFSQPLIKDEKGKPAKTKEGFNIGDPEYKYDLFVPGSKDKLEPGSEVTLRMEDMTYINGTYQQLNAYANGVRIGYIPTISQQENRRKKIEASTNDSDEVKKSKLRTNEAYTDVSKGLYKMYEDWVKENPKKSFKLQVAESVSATTAEEGQSMGITWGDINRTEKNSVITYQPINTAFGKNAFTRDNQKVYLTTYYGDEYLVIDAKDKHTHIEKVNESIIIPKSLRKKVVPSNTVTSGRSNYNGQTFALIPTNTFDKNGKHIYFPVKLNTKMSSDPSMMISRDGKQVTAFEEIMRTIINPEHNVALWNDMFRMIGAKLPISGTPHTDPETLGRLYTDRNLLDILNRLVFINATDKKGPNTLSKIPVALGVITEDDGQKRLKIEYGGKQIFMNLVRKNKDGKLATVGEIVPWLATTDRKKSQDKAKGKETHEAFSTASDPKLFDELVKMVATKPLRVDKRWIQRSNQYTGFVVEDGQLMVKTYGNYADYLTNNGVLTSHVHAMDVGSKGKPMYTFFNEQKMYLRPILAKTESTAGKASSTNSSEPKSGKGSVANTRMLVLNDFDRKIISNSLKLHRKSDNSAYFLVSDEKESPIERVSHRLFGQEDANETKATKVGTIVDLIFKSMLTIDSFQKWKDYGSIEVDNYVRGILKAKMPSDEVLKQTYKAATAFMEMLKSKGEVLVGTDVRVYHIGLKPTGGEIDILVRKSNGKYKNYDLKTKNKGVNVNTYVNKKYEKANKKMLSEYETHSEQARAYADLFNKMYGDGMMDEAEIVFMGVDYKTSTITAANLMPVNGSTSYPLDLNDIKLDRLDLRTEAEKNKPVASALPKVIPASKTGRRQIGPISDEDRSIGNNMSDRETPAKVFNTVGKTTKDLSQLSNLLNSKPVIEPRFDYSLEYFNDPEAGGKNVQDAYTNYVVEYALKILNRRHMINPELPPYSMPELLKRTVSAMEARLATEYNIIDSSTGIAAENAQNKANLLEYILDRMSQKDSNSFAGYYRLALGQLSGMGIVKVKLNVVNEIVFETADGETVPYTSHFKDNWYAQLNPKSTIRPEMKIFLATIPVLEREIVDDKPTYKTRKDSITGASHRYDPDYVINRLSQKMEGVPPSKIREYVISESYSDPMFHSITNAIDNLERYYTGLNMFTPMDIKQEKEKRYQQLASMLTTQRRDLKSTIMSAKDKGGVQFPIIDTARQGVRAEIVREMEAGFRDVMLGEFYSIEEIPDTSKRGAIGVEAKAKVHEFKGYDIQSGEAMKIEIELPENPDVPWQFGYVKYHAARAIKSLYNKAKSQSDKVFDLVFDEVKEGGRLVGFSIGGVTLSQSEVAALITSSEVPANVRVPMRFVKMVDGLNPNAFNQIWNMINSLLINTGVSFTTPEEGAPVEKSKDDYYPEVYKGIADQLLRMGVSLAEDRALSWLALSDLNQSNTVQKKYQYEDYKAHSFRDYLEGLLQTQILEQLSSAQMQGLRDSQQEDILNEPFSKSNASQGFRKLSKAVRGHWTTYTNDSVRTMNGNTEYTLTPANGLSILFDKMNAKADDGDNGFLQQLAKTDTLKFDPIVKEMLGNPNEAIMTLHYADGMRFFRNIIEPEGIKGIENLLMEYAFYGNNESSSDSSRGKGYYSTTHSDSSAMPLISFQKNHLIGILRERVGDNGIADYDFVIDKRKGTGIYDSLLGRFKGEVQRIIHSYQAWASLSQVEDKEERILMSRQFKHGVHYSYDADGVPNGLGSGINMYSMGSRLFHNNLSGVYNDDDKSAINPKLIFEGGAMNEQAVEEQFNRIIDSYVNDLVTEELERMQPYMQILFENTIENGETKVKSKYIDERLIAYIGKRLNQTGVQKVDGEFTTGNDLNTLYPPKLKRADLRIEQPGLTDEEYKAIEDARIKERELMQEGKILPDSRGNTYQNALIKMLITDYVLNGSVMAGTLHYIMGDPANYNADRSNHKTEYGFTNYAKRQKQWVSPGTPTASESFSRKLTFKDIKAKDFRVQVSDAVMESISPEDRASLNKIFSHLKIVDNKLPFAWREYLTEYNAAKDKEASIISIRRDKLDTWLFDGASMVTLREGLNRRVLAGQLTELQALGIYNKLSDPNHVPSENDFHTPVLKYVISGNNAESFGDEVTGEHHLNVSRYGKQAEIWLLPSATRGTILDQVRRNMEEMEHDLNRVYSTPADRLGIGVRLTPTTSEKVVSARPFSLFNEDGSVNTVTNEEIDLEPYEDIRSQIEAPDEMSYVSTEANQGKKYKYIDIPSNYRFGINEFSRYTQRFEDDPLQEEIEEDEDDQEVMRGDGVSASQIHALEVRLTEQRIRNRFEQTLSRLGVVYNSADRKYKVAALDRFLQVLKESAVARKGFDANSLAFLRKAANDIDELNFPIDFTPNSSSFQSVIASILEDTFTGMTLPGGTFAMTSSVYFREKVTGDSNLKGYRETTVDSKRFTSVEDLKRTYSEDEIVPDSIRRDGNGFIATLKAFEYGEVQIAWNLTDENGDILPYDKYVNPDGTIKPGMIDDSALKIIASRIPNTGANATMVLRIAKFFPPKSDMIAVHPSLVAILGADFDYDKLFVYSGHNVVDETGKVSRLKSFLHPSQKGVEVLNTDISNMAYVRRILTSTDNDYNTLNENLKAEMRKAEKKRDQAFLTKLNDEIERIEQEAYSARKKIFPKLSMYDRMSPKQIENALIDIYHLIYGDYKMLAPLTTSLSSQYVNQLTTKQVPGGNFSYADLNERKKFQSYSSRTTYSRERESNSQAGMLVGVAANMQNQQVMAQQHRLYHKPDMSKYGNRLPIQIADNAGKLKTETYEIDKNGRKVVPANDTVKFSIINPYTMLIGEQTMEEAVCDWTQGRFRFDRIYTINNEGKKVLVSTYIKSFLQATLDNQKESVVNRTGFNMQNINAGLVLLLQGYVDEPIPMINSEIVKLWNDRLVTDSLQEEPVGEYGITRALVIEFAKAAGLHEIRVNEILNPKDEQGNDIPTPISHGIQALLQVIDNKPDFMSEQEINIAKQKELDKAKDQRYYAVQLQVLKNFWIASQIGKDFLALQLATNAESKGLASTATGIMSQQEAYNNLLTFGKNPDKVAAKERPFVIGGTIKSIGNVHRMDNRFLNVSDIPHKLKRRRYDPNFYQLANRFGVDPASQIISSRVDMFFSTSRFMKRIYETAWYQKHNWNTDKADSMLQPAKDRNKIYNNFVSFVYSNPDLYKDLFDIENNPEEFDYFKAHARELLIKPSAESELNSDWSMFFSVGSLPLAFRNIIKDKTKSNLISEYEIFQVLRAYVPVDKGLRPSNLSYSNANDYRSQIDERVVKSIVDLYNSDDKDLNSLAKRLILYAYMTGGVNSPSSFVKLIPESITNRMGLGPKLRDVLSTVDKMSDKQSEGLRKTFLLQMYQHDSTDVTSIDTTYLVETDGDYVTKDEELDRKIIKLTTDGIRKYKGRQLLKIEGEKNAVYLFAPANLQKGIWMQVDKLGNQDGYSNVREYRFPNQLVRDESLPGESLFYFNLSESSRRVPNADAEYAIDADNSRRATSMEDAMIQSDAFNRLGLLTKDDAYYKVFNVASYLYEYQDNMKSKNKSVWSEMGIAPMIPFVDSFFKLNDWTVVESDDPPGVMTFDHERRVLKVYPKEMNRVISNSLNPTEEMARLFIHEGIHTRLNSWIYEAVTKTEKNYDKQLFKSKGHFNSIQQVVENTEKLRDAVMRIIKTDPIYKNDGEKLQLYEDYLAGRVKESPMMPGDEWVRAFLGDDYRGTDLNKEHVRFKKLAEFMAYLADGKFRSIMNTIDLDGTKAVKGGKKDKRNALILLWEQFVALLNSLFNGRTPAQTFKELQAWFNDPLATVNEGSALHAALWQFYKMDETLPRKRQTAKKADFSEFQSVETPAVVFSNDNNILQEFNREERLDRRSKRMGDTRKNSWLKELQGKYPELEVSFEEYNDELIVPKAELREGAEPIPPAQNVETPYVSFGDNEEKPVKIDPESFDVGGRAFKQKLLVGNFVDPYIVALDSRINDLSKEMSIAQSPDKRLTLKRQIIQLKAQRAALAEKATTEALQDIAYQQFRVIRNHLYNETTSSGELLSNLSFLNAWKDFYKLTTGLEESDFSEEDRARFNDIVGQANNLFVDNVQVFINRTKDKLGEYGIKPTHAEAVDKVVNDISGFKYYLEGLSFGSTEVEFVVNKLIRDQSVKSTQRKEDFQQKFKNEFALINKDLSFMFQKDSNGVRRLLSKRKQELWDDLKKLKEEIKEYEEVRSVMRKDLKKLYMDLKNAQVTGDALSESNINAEITALDKKIKEDEVNNPSWLHYQFYMKTNFDYTPSAGSVEEMVKEFENFKQELAGDLVDENADPYLRERQLKQLDRIANEYDPRVFMDWLEGKPNVRPNSGAIFFAIDPKAEHNNPAYDNLNSSQKRFYDFFVDAFVDANERIKRRENMDEFTLDKLVQQFYFMDETTSTVMGSMLKDGTEWGKGLVTVGYREDVIDYSAKGPLSGQEQYRLKMKTIKDFIIDRDSVYHQGEELPQSIQSGIDAGRFYWKEGVLYKKKNNVAVPKFSQVESKPENAFMNFVMFSYDFQTKAEVEDTLKSLNEISAYSGVAKQTAGGDQKYNLFATRMNKANENNVQARMKYTSDAWMYDRRKNEYSVQGKLTPGERKFSWERTIDTVNDFTRARNMALNPFSAIGNLGLGTVNNFIYASGKTFFNEVELWKAYGHLRGSMLNFFGKTTFANKHAKVIARLMARWNILGDNHDLKYNDDNQINKLLDNLYVMQSRGEFLNQGAVLAATMIHQKIKDKSGKEHELLEMFDLDENDNLVIKEQFKGTEFDDFNRMSNFMAGVVQINKQIHGDYDPRTPIVLKRFLLGRVAMLFRGWLPQAINQRFGARQKDLVLTEAFGEDIETEGRWRTFARVLFKGQSPAGIAVNFGKLAGSVLLQTVSNKRMSMSGEVSELDKRNMGMAIKELWFMVMIASVSSIFQVLAEDDDEEEKMSALKYIYNQTSRIESELWFMYSPSDAKKFAKDIIPLMSTVDQGFKVAYSGRNLVFNPEDDVYKRGFRKGHSKFAKETQIFLPVIKQGQTFWSTTSQIFDNDPYQ